MIADANKATLDRMSVFEHYELDPGGISGTDFPEFMALKCSRKIVNKTISQIAVSLGGQNVGNIVRNTSPTPPATDPAAPFNNGVPELSGGIVNLVLTAQARTNLKNSVGVANRSPQFIGVNVTVTFTDGTSASDLLHFGTNNNAFDLARNPALVAAVDARVKTRFETAVGASPAVLPVGTYELALKVAQATSGANRDRKAHKRILVSDLTAADERMYFRFGNNNVEVTMRYVAATRTLTYSGSNINSLKAIGEA